jgi:hypothetical protein
VQKRCRGERTESENWVEDGDSRELENEIISLKAEMTVTRGEKNKAEQECALMRRDLEGMEREIRTKEHDLQRFDVKEESIKGQLMQANDRVQELKDENHALKSDKEKLFSKVDHLMYENENLRNEIFMLKRIMLEVEKRDLSGPALQDRLREEFPRNQPTPPTMPRSRQDPELEQLRRDRSSRSPLTRQQSSLQQAPVQQSSYPVNTRPQSQQYVNNQSSSQFQSSQYQQDKPSTKQSGLFNRGSQGSDIITWDNPYNNAGPNRQSRDNRVQAEPRDRRLIEEQLVELDNQIEKTQGELSNVVNGQPRTGVTMRKKRELEDRLDLLDKQRQGLRSRLRMGMNR